MDVKDFLDDFYSSEIIIAGYSLNEKVIFDSRKTISIEKIVKNCEFNSGGLFNNLNINSRITFDECDFFNTEVGSNTIDFSIKGRHHLTFINCRFHCEVIFKLPDSLRINFNECIFKSDLIIHRLSQKECTITIGDSKIDKIYFFNSHFTKLTIKKTIVQDVLKFNNVNINSINILDGNYNFITFNNCNNLNELNIKNTSFDRGKININKLFFKNINLKGSIRLQGATIKNYNISPFNNEGGRFVHQNISFLEEVIMMDSDLTNVQFNEVDFSNSNLCLDNSYLSDTVFSNILWPTNKEVTHYSDTSTYKGQHKPEDWKTKESREKALIKKEIYRQLKNSSKSESNNIDALEFYRNEMSSYWGFIKGNKEIPKWDRFLVRVSKWAGDFGLSYTIPLKRLFVIHSILFTSLVLLNYQDLCFTCRELTLDSFSAGLGEYVYLLNPVHKLKNGLTGWEITIDFIMRLINGFFIYHFIRATRKFAKL